MNIRAPRRPWESQHKQGTRYNKDSFYSSSAWRKTRAAFLQAHPICEHCLKEGKTTRAEMVDHRERIKQGGDRLDWDNLQSLCNHHHAVKSANESNERNKR